MPEYQVLLRTADGKSRRGEVLSPSIHDAQRDAREAYPPTAGFRIVDVSRCNSIEDAMRTGGRQ